MFETITIKRDTSDDEEEFFFSIHFKGFLQKPQIINQSWGIRAHSHVKILLLLLCSNQFVPQENRTRQDKYFLIFHSHYAAAANWKQLWRNFSKTIFGFSTFFFVFFFILLIMPWKKKLLDIKKEKTAKNCWAKPSNHAIVCLTNIKSASRNSTRVRDEGGIRKIFTIITAVEKNSPVMCCRKFFKEMEFFRKKTLFLVCVCVFLWWLFTHNPLKWSSW